MDTSMYFCGKYYNDVTAIFETANKKQGDIIEEQVLWAAVLKLAIKDLNYPVGHIYSSVRWFLSNNDGVGSFLWICEQINADPFFVIKLYGHKIKRSLANKYTYENEELLRMNKKYHLKKAV